MSVAGAGYRSFALFLSLLFFALLLLFSGLPSIAGSSEAREAHIVALMYKNGNYVLPLRNGIIPSKPPLFHWCGSLLSHISGGPSPFTARLTSIIMATGAVYLTLLLTMGLMDSKDEREARLACVISLFALSLTHGFTGLAGDARVDMTCGFFMLLAIFVVLRNFSSGPEINGKCGLPVRERDMTLFFAASAFAVLAKGPVGLALPLLVVSVFCFYCTKSRGVIMFLLRPRLGWVVFLAICLPWYVFAAVQGGEAFFVRQVVFENFLRFSGGAVMKRKPFLFYVLPLFFNRAFPWSVLFILFALGIIRSAPAAGERQRTEARCISRVQHLPLIWFLTGLFFFSLAAGKRHSYLLPIFPAMSIGLGWYVVGWWRGLSQKSSWRVKKALLWGSLALIILQICLMLGFEIVKRSMSSDPLIQLALESLAPYALRCQIVLCASAFAAAASMYYWRMSSLARLVLLWFSVFSVYAMTYFSFLTVKNSFKQFDQTAFEIGQHLAEGERLRILRRERDEFFDQVMYYLELAGRKVEFWNPQSGADLPCDLPLYGRLSDFEKLYGKGSPRLHEIRTFNIASDRYRNRNHRATVLFSCGDPS